MLDDFADETQAHLSRFPRRSKVHGGVTRRGLVKLGLLGPVLLLTQIQASCGGEVEPERPFLDVGGCAGNEIVQPRGFVRLLAEIPEADAPLSVDDANVYCPPYVVSRATGAVSTDSRQPSNAVIHDGWFFQLDGVGGRAGPIGSGGELIDPVASLPLRSKGRDFTDGVLVYLPSLGSWAFWNPTSGARGRTTSENCYRPWGAIVAGGTVVWSESSVTTSCHPGAPEMRVHFARHNQSVVASALGQSFSNTVQWIDASSTIALVSWDVDIYLFKADGTGRRLQSGGGGELRDIVVTPTAAIGLNYGGTSTAKVEMRLPDLSGTSTSLGEVSGIPTKRLEHAYHDRKGAYWFLRDPDRKLLRIWTLDFDFLGCPAD